MAPAPSRLPPFSAKHQGLQRVGAEAPVPRRIGIPLAREGKMIRPRSMPSEEGGNPSPEESMMSSHLVLSGVDDGVKARLEKYWEKKLPRLQKLLVPYRTDLQEIRLTVSRHRRNAHGPWYEGR